MRKCHFCKTVLEDNLEVFRSTLCPACSKDLKICLNCVFYSPGDHWDCRETIEEAVREKDRANFCSFFSFMEVSAADGGQKSGISHEKARKEFENLFGDNG